MKKKAIILCSGGVDSTTVLALAMEQQYECYVLSFNYGQRNIAELDAIKHIIAGYGGAVCDHKILNLDLTTFGHSSLTDAQMPVEQNRTQAQLKTQIPNTYVPARNTIFLSCALAYAESVEAYDIFIGANVHDYSGYPDCRPGYLRSFETMANLATKTGAEGKGHFTIHAPLLKLTKAEIIQEGLRLNIDYGLTVSCYDPLENAKGCGYCDPCQFRAKAFKALGLKDPVIQDELWNTLELKKAS